MFFKKRKATTEYSTNAKDDLMVADDCVAFYRAVNALQDFQKEVKSILERLETKHSEEVKSLRMEIDASKEEQKKILRKYDF